MPRSAKSYTQAGNGAGVKGYLRLVRPLNCVMSAAGCTLGAFVAIGEAFTGDISRVLQAASIAFLFTAAGNSLNDYSDREVDRINHPERPIPAGLVTPTGALVAGLMLFAPAIPWSLLLGWELLVVVLVNMALISSYESVFKREGFRGNLLISWLVASLFVFGGLAVYSGSGEALQRVLILAVLAFLATLGREVIKDIQDMAGDVGRWTLPMTLGERKSGLVASGVLLAAVALSFLPSLLQILGSYYLYAVVVADVILVYAALTSYRRPAVAQRAVKYGMTVALVAFLVGGL